MKFTFIFIELKLYKTFIFFGGEMIELLRNRRSVRNFTQQSVEAEKIELLSEAVLRSPSSKNRTPWEFVVVDDLEKIEKLAEAKSHGASFAKKAPLIFVILGDTEKSDMCIEDCSIAATTLHYFAETLGLGSCWIQLRDRERSDNSSSEDYVRGLFNIPDNFLVLAMVAVGYPAEKPAPHTADHIDKSKIHYNKF